MYDADRYEDAERRIEEILLSGADPVSKVKQLMQMGFEEEEANDLVERYQIGEVVPVYYERLMFEDEPADY